MISCLCVTYGRARYLRRAIECYIAQSHTETELVIVTDSADDDSIHLALAYEKFNVRLVTVSSMKSYTLGEVRNVAIDSAAGKYVCTWDDDDWYNIDRLEVLAAALKRHKKKCVLQSRVLLYDEVNSVSYLSYRRMWENTLIVEKKYLYENKIFYPNLNKNEDYKFLNQLIERNAVYALDDASLYIYRFSGDNTCDKKHFEVMFGYSIELPSYHHTVLKKAFDESSDVTAVSKSIYSNYFLSNLVYVPNVENRI